MIEVTARHPRVNSANLTEAKKFQKELDDFIKLYHENSYYVIWLNCYHGALANATEKAIKDSC